MSTLFDLKDIKNALPQIPSVEKKEKPQAQTDQKAKKSAPEPAVEKPEPAASAEQIAGTADDGPEAEDAEELEEDGSAEEKEEPEEGGSASEEASDTPEEKQEATATAESKPAAKRYEKKETPRDPYEWGKCPLAIIVQVLKQDGNPKGQWVRVGVHSHDNPTEPPKIKSFRVADLPNPLPESFWAEVKKTANEMIATIVKEFPDREAAWKANKEHKRDPEPFVHNKVAAKTKTAGKKADKPKPPSISNATMSMFKPEEKKGADNA